MSLNVLYDLNAVLMLNDVNLLFIHSDTFLSREAQLFPLVVPSLCLSLTWDISRFHRHD